MAGRTAVSFSFSFRFLFYDSSLLYCLFTLLDFDFDFDFFFLSCRDRRKMYHAMNAFIAAVYLLMRRDMAIIVIIVSAVLLGV